MKEQIFKLNCLRPDFMKWAVNNEKGKYELKLNKINGGITGFYPENDPTVLLDCTKSEGEWILFVNCDDDKNRSYPIATLTADQIYDFRICVESWIVEKESSILFI